MNQNWNAEKYSSGFSFVYQYGQDVLNLITLPSLEEMSEKLTERFTAIDLGCGTGTLTKALSDRGFNVIGIQTI